MSCSGSYPPTPQPTATASANMDVLPGMQQSFSSWGEPSDPFGSAPRRRSRPSSRSPTEDGSTFRFITATKPEEFKDKELMRGVRSHVMFDVIGRRHKHPVPVAKTQTTSASQRRRGESSGGGEAAAAAARTHQSLSRADSASSNPNNPEIISNRDALDILHRYEKPRPSPASIVSTTPRSEGTEGSSPETTRPAKKRTRASAPSAASSAADPEDVEQVLVQPPEGGMGFMNPLFTAAQPISFSTVSEIFPSLPQNLFSPYDPFHTLPQPSNPRINVEQLKWYCHHYFGTRAMARAWLPQMIAHPESFLSTIGISTTHRDAIEERPAPSFMSSLVSAEVTRLINAALQDRWTRIRDSTIMSVVHLLCSRLVVADSQELRRHERGLGELIKQRGGLDCLGVHGELAAVASAMCYTSAIFRGGPADQIFLDYEPERKFYDNKQAIPESPLFCPRSRFLTLERSKRCSKQTLTLLGQAKELTDLASTVSEASAWDVEAQKRARLDCIQKAPSADRLTGDDGMDNKARNRYEACRLAATMYASSIVSRAPLPSQASSATLSALVAAIKNSDSPYSECWGDMTGVLYWITLVGAAAAKDQPQKAYLAALNVRCAIVLAFEHKTAVVSSLKKMLRAVESCQSWRELDVVV